MKMRYYIQPLKKFAKSSFEGRLWEVVVALISAIFSYQGFKANLAIVAFPMAGVCFICVVGLLTSIYFNIKERFFSDK